MYNFGLLSLPSNMSVSSNTCLIVPVYCQIRGVDQMWKYSQTALSIWPHLRVTDLTQNFKCLTIKLELCLLYLIKIYSYMYHTIDILVSFGTYYHITNLRTFICMHVDMNRERIRLVGGLRAILTLLKEFLSDSISDPDQLEQAVHLVRLLTTCVTDNGNYNMYTPVYVYACTYMYSIILLVVKTLNV